MRLLDTEAEPEFDCLTQFASEICDTPVALISFIDSDRVLFKSRVGFQEPQAPRTGSFCSHVIEDTDPLIVEDASTDPRFQNNAFVQASQGIRFYAGIPLVLTSGIAVGSLCVIDNKVRNLSTQQLSGLKRLASLVVALIEVRRTHFLLLQQEKERLLSEQRLDFALKAADIGDWDMDLRTHVIRRSLQHDLCFGYREAVPEWGYDTLLAHVYQADRAHVDDSYQRAMAGEGFYDVEFRVVWPDQSLHWLWLKGRFYFDELDTPTRVSGILVDITQRKNTEAQVHHLAFHDSLTGLPNRMQFLNFANGVLRSKKPTGQLNAGILLDLDNFKSINDHWGHRSGDELLKQVALRIQQCLPQGSFIARLGGDEFIVVATDLGPDRATASVVAQDLCNKIIQTLAKGFLIEQREHFTSASLGIALFGEAGMTVDELLSRADSAMYSAKANGRNAFCFFDGELQAQLAAQSELEGELRQSIQNNELHLAYQPQVDQLGHIVGAEALLRWSHPLRGLVSPAQFIPVAESSGVIIQIGQWVMHTACLALAAWQSNPSTAGLPVAVNVSARQFHHPDFVNQVLFELETSGANPELLKLELTESLLAQDLSGIVQKMNALKSRGVTFSLDDFGTGYSSLAYLKRLPLDQLKIDQGFVRDVLVDASDAAIVRTVIALGDRLGLNVIAEGVETQEQREFLESNGCNAYQGYLFSRPLRESDFEIFCSTRR